MLDQERKQIEAVIEKKLESLIGRVVDAVLARFIPEDEDDEPDTIVEEVVSEEPEGAETPA